MATNAIEDSVNRSYDMSPKYDEMMPGVPEDYKAIKTLGQLLEVNYKHASVEEQLRGNLLSLPLIELFFRGMKCCL